MQPRGYSCPRSLHTATDWDSSGAGVPQVPKPSMSGACLPCPSYSQGGRCPPCLPEAEQWPKPMNRGKGAAGTHRAAQPGCCMGKDPCGFLVTTRSLI